MVEMKRINCFFFTRFHSIQNGSFFVRRALIKRDSIAFIIHMNVLYIRLSIVIYVFTTNGYASVNINSPILIILSIRNKSLHVEMICFHFRHKVESKKKINDAESKHIDFNARMKGK